QFARALLAGPGLHAGGGRVCRKGVASCHPPCTSRSITRQSIVNGPSTPRITRTFSGSSHVFAFEFHSRSAVSRWLNLDTAGCLAYSQPLIRIVFHRSKKELLTAP